MRTKRNHRSSLIVVLSLVLPMAMLTACSSATVEETKVSETVEVKEEVVKVEVAEAEPTAEPTPEPTPEPTAEPTPKPTPVVYEGIDMESTLPGAEWVESFSGIINEPKLVVYNDTTNKKIILEDFQEVEFAKDDVLAIYSPIDATLIKQYDYTNFQVAELGNLVMSLKNVSDTAWGIGRSLSNNVVEHNGNDIELNCILLFTE